MRIPTVAPLAIALSNLFFPVPAVAQEQSRTTQLTDDPAQDGFPSWSPDGQRIVFSRYGREDAPEKTGLWWISPDGGESHQLTNVPGEHPDWSPKGDYVVFDGDYGESIQLVSASGGTPIRIVPESIPVFRGGQPKWSPDGTRVAFKAGPTLWVLDVSSGRIDTVFSAPGKLPIPTCWSPDGAEIYLYLRGAQDPTASITAISPGEKNVRTVASDTTVVYRYADLSPDGSLLAVVLCEGHDCDLWVMSSSGGPRIQITSGPAYDDGPSWSPDGTRIAFVSTRSGQFDIWMVDVDINQVREALTAANP